MDLPNEIIHDLHDAGADKVGFADLSAVEPEVRNNLPTGISIAVALKPDIIANIAEGPNRQYFEEYRRANILLDHIGKRAADFLNEHGYRTVQLASTNIGVNWHTLSTVLPHKTIATKAGLGWIGKCALLVTREFGSAVRIASVLTDAVLPVNSPQTRSECGNCTNCVDSCPGHAVTGNNWNAGVSRDYLYDAYKCVQAAQAFEETREGLHENICGICMVVCPWTIKYLNQNSSS